MLPQGGSPQQISSVRRGRLGLIPDPCEFLGDQWPDQPKTIVARGDLIGQGRENNEFVWNDSTCSVFPTQWIREAKRHLAADMAEGFWSIPHA